MIELARADNCQIKIKEKEVYRYLGYKSINQPENSISSLVKKCITKIENNMICKACYKTFPIQKNTANGLNLSFLTTHSNALSKNLCECHELILFVATIGIEIDRLIEKNSILSPATAIVLQAAGAAAIEEWCDVLCSNLAIKYKKSGKFLTPRFSPGYGDFPLESQKSIFTALDCHRKIGVSLTENHMMVPTKSVSAIIGISDKKTSTSINKCNLCENKECKFRKE